MKYGLGTCSASLKELEDGLGKTDFYLLSRLGVTRSIPAELRYMPHRYCGMELNNLPVETTIAQINSLLQRYGTKTALGTTLTAAIEHLRSEAGETVELTGDSGDGEEVELLRSLPLQERAHS